jgi:MFS family permease
MKADVVPANIAGVIAAAPALVATVPPMPIYVAEALGCHAANLLGAGAFFFTAERFGWGAGRNLLLAAATGVVFTVVALLATRMTAWVGMRATATIGLIGMAVSAAAALVAQASPVPLAIAVVAHCGCSALLWPSLESLACTGLTHAQMARRLAVYNTVWPAAGAATVPLVSPILHSYPSGLFVLALAANVVAAAALWIGHRPATPLPSESVTHDADDAPHPEPELVRVRTRALWLSRVALPAAFVASYGIMAIMPSLPLMHRLPPETHTLVAGIWLAARWVGFVFCGWTTWWHTRPRAMLAAVALMLIAFLGVALPWPFPWWLDPGTAAWVAWVAAWQVVLGFCLALICSASLYFGMVLSDASVEHSGYHEALVGLGTVVGPGAGALAQYYGGSDPIWGTVAVGSVIAASVAASAVVALRHSRGDTNGADAPAPLG